MFKLNKPLGEEVLDQALHFLSNAAIVMVLVHILHINLGGAVATAAAYTLLREAAQHRESKHCQEGCQRDIFFSFLGILAGSWMML